MNFSRWLCGFQCLHFIARMYDIMQAVLKVNPISYRVIVAFREAI